ncbi:MAG TPA: peptidase S8 [Phaeodactylibacter sp.]|nr:peptidase S8 [Phaeodactylibacter sp.]
MSTNYNILQRGGHRIRIEKEASFFTAILPDKKLVSEIYKTGQVNQIKKVFNNVYKIKTQAGQSDEVMDQLREDFKTLCVFHHAYIPKQDPATRYYITDLIVVQFKKATRTAIIEKVMKACGLSYMRPYLSLPDRHLFRVTSSAGKNPVKVCADLMSFDSVIHAEPNLINRFDPAALPYDDLFKNQWHLHSKKGIDLVSNAHVHAAEAWKVSKGSRDIVVAVIDDGFDLSHPDLKGDGHKIVHPKDFVDGDLHPFPTVENNDYHGTPCAGVAIGEENGSGIVGIAPACSFMPIRFDLSADDNMLYEIFDYVGKRADVISCSWGPVPVYAPLSSLLYDKISSLAKNGGPRKKGVVIVFAAGNFNAPLKDMRNKDGFEWRHPSKGIIKSSRAILNGNAAHPAVIAVSASNSQNRKSAYSNWGKEITVCAPSDNWHPLDPQAYVPGRGIWTTDNETFGIGFSNNSRYTGYFGGTSSATPLVAGIAALMLSANPSLSAKQVKEILQKTADKIVDKKPDIVLKNKKGTYNSKGHSEWFGYGKVNAGAAVKMAADKIKKPKTKKEKPTDKPSPKSTAISAVQIVSALVNPKGSDTGKEQVGILNRSNDNIDLEGWAIVDNKNRRQIIHGHSLAPGAFLLISLKKPRLGNTGGSITLVDNKGSAIHKVVYTKKQVDNKGWFLVFG